MRGEEPDFLSCNVDLHTVQHGDARPAVYIYLISRVFEHVDRL